MKILKLTEVEYLRLMRPVVGQGGFQNLLRALQRACDDVTHELRVSESNQEQIERYAKDYGEGGFQGRLPMDRLLGRSNPQGEIF